MAWTPAYRSLYESGELGPESVLTGRFERDSAAADVEAVLTQIEDERREAEDADHAGDPGCRLEAGLGRRDSYPLTKGKI